MTPREKSLQALLNRLIRNRHAHVLFINRLYGEHIPATEDLHQAIARYDRRIEAVKQKLGKIRLICPTPDKVVGHICPKTLEQKPMDRAWYARKTAEDGR